MIEPTTEVLSRPRVLDELDLSGLSRTKTSEWVFPWSSVMRESIFPNLNAAYGVQSAQGYTPLVPQRTLLFLDKLSPAMLNLLGVRYYLVPQVLTVDSQTEAADLVDPFMIDPVDHALEFMPTPATAIKVVSSLSQSVDMRDGEIVATIVLTTDHGQTINVPVRAGLDTAEWAYERSDVRQAVKHSEPTIASTFPARSAFPIQTHLGHFYQAELKFSDNPVNITSVSITPRISPGLFHVQKLALRDGPSSVDVATLVGKSNHRLVYRSEDVAVFENPDYAPRAFLTHSALVVPDGEALARLQGPDYGGELLLAGGDGLEGDSGQGLDEQVRITKYEPERVVLEVNCESDAYVVLADAWDPGWVAVLDNQPTHVLRADFVLRAVRVTAGDHRIEFYYRPFSFYAGLTISGFSFAILFLLSVIFWLNGRRTLRPVI